MCKTGLSTRRSWSDSAPGCQSFPTNNPTTLAAIRPVAPTRGYRGLGDDCLRDEVGQPVGCLGRESAEEVNTERCAVVAGVDQTGLH